MGNGAGVRHYFIESFTPYGYISLLSGALRDNKHIYLLTGGPGTGKSTMIKLIGIQLIDRGYDVDYIRSAREPDSVAGIFLPRHNICLLDKEEFLTQKIEIEDNYFREIDFNSFLRKSKLKQYKPKITDLEDDLRELESKLVKQLACDYEDAANNDAKIDYQDYQKIDVLFNNVFAVPRKDKLSFQVEEISEVLSKIKESLLSFCFLHGLQADNWLNLAPRYLKDFDRICLDAGDSAPILREILQEVICLGQVIEIIVHPLKPYSMLGIVFPEKNLAVWKGNPCKLEEQGFHKRHTTILCQILEEYRKTRIRLKSLINDCVNFRGLDDLRSELLSSILADLKSQMN